MKLFVKSLLVLIATVVISTVAFPVHSEAVTNKEGAKHEIYTTGGRIVSDCYQGKCKHTAYKYTTDKKYKVKKKGKMYKYIGKYVDAGNSATITNC